MADPRFLQRTQTAGPLAGMGYTFPGELGYIAQSVLPETVVPGIAQLGVAGTMFLRRMSLPGPVVLTDMSFIISTVGVTLTAGQNFGVVYDQAFNLVGITADQSAAWVAGVGLVTMALTAPAGSNGLGIDTPYCYAGFWWNGTTAPFFARGGTADVALVNAFPTAPNARCVSANTGLTNAASAPLQLGALTKLANTHGNLYIALR